MEEINSELFLLRWRKDPGEYVIAKAYQTFYNSTSNEFCQQAESEFLKNDNAEYEYLLNRAWYKVRQIVKTKPETAKTFYNSFNELVQKELAADISENVSSFNGIVNPISIKSKGNCYI